MASAPTPASALPRTPKATPPTVSPPAGRLIASAGKTSDWWARPSSVAVKRDNWSCEDVYPVYGLTREQFTSQNKEDTCASVAEFLGTTLESIQQLNPGVDCSSSTPLPSSHSLCLERNPAFVGYTPSADRLEVVSSREGCRRVVEKSHGSVDMLQLFRLNPGLLCSDALPAAGVRIFTGTTYHLWSANADAQG
ncbi:hypothetical protein CLOM_g5169 [Closterium sp. NIES-68]|nr:hypothetical protein CLOM_g5169 [Closterium sp. NIES-68]GJP82945.1 hypothetical protein CLOP_g13164 [Closterium sp. NIES-67]